MRLGNQTKQSMGLTDIVGFLIERTRPQIRQTWYIIPLRSVSAHRAAACILTALLMTTGIGTAGFAAGMRAPETRGAVRARGDEVETSSGKIVLLGSIRLFQKRISPIEGPRCRLFPTCSHYGYQAIREYGPLRGILMTGDRLLRCNPSRRPGSDYPLLPNGRLYDPVSRNSLFTD